MKQTILVIVCVLSGTLHGALAQERTPARAAATGQQQVMAAPRGDSVERTPEEIQALQTNRPPRAAVPRGQTAERRNFQIAQAATAGMAGSGIGDFSADLGGIAEYASLDFTEWEWIEPGKMYLFLYNMVAIHPEMNFIRARIDKWEQGWSMASIHYYVSQHNVGKPHVITIDIDFSQSGTIQLYDGTQEDYVDITYEAGEMSIHELALPDEPGKHSVALTFSRPESTGEHRLLFSSVSVVTP